MSNELEVPIRFEYDIVRQGHIAKPMARVYIGKDSVCYLMFCPDGVTRLFLPDDAIDDGLIHFYNPNEIELPPLYNKGD